ncbi:MAG: hypothetical protein Q4D92_02115 [Slackia sp.]|nr:hypothetical protein [Slackia sp.]
MARKKMVTSNDMHKMRVFGGKRRTKRIGKVKSCVFHPSEKRCVGFMVKRPDLLWMFHRKDLFVALDGFSLSDGRIVVKDEGETTGPAACRRMGIDWDSCVIWEGMPLMTADGTAVGYVGNISFSLATGEVASVEASNGVTAKYLLGTLEVPAHIIRGFKRGMGATLAVKEDTREAGQAVEFKGAILVSDEVWELSPEGGWAESAGEFTARAKERIHEAAEKAKPKVQEVTQVAGEAINEGAYAVGKQVAASKGMFASFKEEYDKARHGDEAIELAANTDGVEAESEKLRAAQCRACAEDDVPGEDRAGEGGLSGMFSSFKEEYDKARHGDECEDNASDDDGEVDGGEADEVNADEGVRAKKESAPAKKQAASAKKSSVSGMFAAFKEEYDKARYDD